ncbi:MAG: Gx transporter family protein [Fibrobacteria bacterium]
MPSPINRDGISRENPAAGSGEGPQSNAKVTPEAFALALLIACCLQVMENLLPRLPLFPWMRVGFSYVVILPFLLQYGPRAAFGLFLARNVISVLYGGAPLTTFLIGTGSGAVAFLGAGAPVAWAYRRGSIGILGASIGLATTFNLAQMAAVNLILIRHAGFYFQTGPILAWSLVSGTAIAMLIRFSRAELIELFSPPHLDEALAPAPVPATTRARMREFLGGSACLVLLAVLPFVWVQSAALALLVFLVRDRTRLLMHAWPFFFYLAWLHLFHTSGVFWIGEWITREGADNFALYAVRLANLILLGRWLSQRFPWQWMGGSRSVYLQGLLLSLPLLPDLFRASMAMGGKMLRELAAGKRNGVLGPAFKTWRAKLAEAARVARDF